MVLALGKEWVVQKVEMMLALVHLKERQCGLLVSTRGHVLAGNAVDPVSKDAELDRGRKGWMVYGDDCPGS